MVELVLTRDQILKLAKIVEHFKEIKTYTLYETHESGIGPSMHVRFDLMEKQDTKIDITDVSTW